MNVLDVLNYIVAVDGPINSVNIGCPVFYGYIIHSDNIALIYKITVTTDERLSYTFFEFQNINLKTREITKFNSPYLNEAAVKKVSNDKVYYKVKKLIDFLNVIINNKKAFDSTVSAIITTLKS